MHETPWQEVCGAVGQSPPVNPEYIEDVILPRTQHILWYQSRQGRRTTWDRMDGFLLSRVLRKTRTRPRVYYVDLVCSRHRKGRALLRAAEVHAAERGCHYMALRVAHDDLIPYYYAQGYRREYDHCRGGPRDPGRLRRADHATQQQRDRGDPIDGWWMSKCIFRRGRYDVPRDVALQACP